MQLIKIDSTTIGQEVKETVNARDLHEFLESKADFSAWTKTQIKRAKLVEGRDFVTVTKKRERQTFVDRPKQLIFKGAGMKYTDKDRISGGAVVWLIGAAVFAAGVLVGWVL